MVHQHKKVGGDGASADPPPSNTSLHPSDAQAQQHDLTAKMHEVVVGGAHGAVGPHPDHHDKHAPKLDPKTQALIDQMNAVTAHAVAAMHQAQLQKEAEQKQHDLKRQVMGPAAMVIAGNLSRLAFSMNDANSKAFIQQLDAITDPDLRAVVKEQFKVQHMGEDLDHFIRNNHDWNNSGDGRDAKAALQLISSERDEAENNLAKLDPKVRADKEHQAELEAGKLLAELAAHDHSDENMQKVFRTLGHKSPEDIELLRAAMRKMSDGHTNLYQAIDDGTHKGDEDEALAMLEGNPTKSAEAALKNESDPKRQREVLDNLSADEAKNLDEKVKATALAKIENPADRAEIAAAMRHDPAAADGERLGNILKPKKQGEVNGEFNPYDKNDQENYDRRKPKNVLKEFEAMSGEQVKAAAEAWHRDHPNDPSFMQMLEARWGDDDDKTELHRLQAMIEGDKGKNRSIRLQEGLKDKDQDEIEGALAHQTVAGLSKDDPDYAKKLVSITSENGTFEANNVIADQKAAQTAHDTFHLPGEVKARSTKDQLKDYYAARKADDIGGSFGESYLGGDAGKAIHKDRQDKHDKEVADHEAGAMDLLNDGELSVSVETYRAKSDKDKLAVMEKLKDNGKLKEAEDKYEATYHEKMFPVPKDSREDMSTAELQIDNIRKYGAKEQRPAQLEYKLQTQIYKHGYSKSLEESEAYEAGGGTQQLQRWELEREAKMMAKDPGINISGPVIVTDRMGIKHAVDDPKQSSEADIEASLPKDYIRPTTNKPPTEDEDGLKKGVSKDEFNRTDAAVSEAGKAQQDAKKRMAERLIKIFSTIAKIAAALTLQPELIAAIDIAEGVLEIVIKKEIIGKDYSMKDDLKMLVITGVADVAMMGFAKYGKGAAKMAEEVAMKEAEQLVLHEAETGVENLAKNEVESELVHQGTAEVENVAKNEVEQKVTQAAEGKVAGEVEGQAASTIKKEVAQEIEKDTLHTAENAAETAAKEALSPAALAKQIEARWGLYGNAAKTFIQTVGGGIANGQSPLEILRSLAAGGAGLIIPGALGEKIRGAIGNETAAAKLLAEVFGTSAEYVSALTINVAGGADPSQAAFDTAIGVGGGRAQHLAGGHGGSGAKHEESAPASEQATTPAAIRAPEPTVATEPTMATAPTAVNEAPIPLEALRAPAPDPISAGEPMVRPEPAISQEPVAAPGREPTAVPELPVVAEPAPAGPEVESIDAAPAPPEATVSVEPVAPEPMSIGGAEPSIGSADSGTPQTELRNDGTDYRRGANPERTIGKANEKLAAMDPASRAQHDELFQRAESRTQQALLERSIAAGASYDELTDLMSAMSGKSDAELLLTMTGAQLIQLYKTACVPASYQIGIADKNPVFALEMHRNPKAALEGQGQALQAAGGRRTPRDNMASPSPELQRHLDNPDLAAAFKQDSAFDPSRGPGPDGKVRDGIDPSRMKDSALHKEFERVNDSKYVVLGNTDVTMTSPDGRFESSNLPHDRMQRALDQHLPVLVASGNHQQTIIGYEKNGNDIYYIVDDPDTAGTKRVSAANLDASDVQALTLPVDEQALVLAPEMGPIATADADSIGGTSDTVAEPAQAQGSPEATPPAAPTSAPAVSEPDPADFRSFELATGMTVVGASHTEEGLVYRVWDPVTQEEYPVPATNIEGEMGVTPPSPQAAEQGPVVDLDDDAWSAPEPELIMPPLPATGTNEVSETAQENLGDSELITQERAGNPTPQESESSAANTVLGDFPFREQVSYRDGEEVPYASAGSTRPDLSSEQLRMSVEVKNYDVTTEEGRERLVRNVTTQAIGRAPNLPEGMRQAVLVDVRGRDVTPADLAAIREEIVDRSDGNIIADNVEFITDNSDED